MRKASTVVEDWRLNDDEEEDFSGEGSTSEEDYASLEFSEEDHASDDDDEDWESVRAKTENSNVFLGKDNTTEWHKTYTVFGRVRKKPDDAFANLPASRSTDAKTISDAWKLYFPDTLIEKIVKCTNENIDIVRTRYVRKRECQHTTRDELLALFGLLYISGVMKSSHLSLSDLWTEDGTGVDIFRATLAVHRFKFLLNCIRFDDISTRQERRCEDQMAPIREVFTEFVASCEKHMDLSENVTVGDTLIKFRGQCPFKHHVNPKKGKVGLKMFALVDSKTLYVSSMEIYVKQQPKGPFAVSNAPSDIVKRLIAPISGTGRNVTIDNSFTSVSLANDLLEQHNLTMIGTLTKSKKKVPQCFLPSSDRELYSSVFGFQKNVTLVSYVPENNKCMLLVSSMPHDSDVERTPEKTPYLINLYNISKGCMAKLDGMINTYSVSRKNGKWHLALFFTMLNIAGVNSQIIHQSNTGDKLSRRKYLKQLGLDLLKMHLNQRRENQRLPCTLKRKINSLLGVEYERRYTPGRCYLCTSRKNRKTQQTCRDCYHYICKEHTQTVCTECSTVETAE